MNQPLRMKIISAASPISSPPRVRKTSRESSGESGSFICVLRLLTGRELVGTLFQAPLQGCDPVVGVLEQPAAEAAALHLADQGAERLVRGRIALREEQQVVPGLDRVRGGEPGGGHGG